MDKIIKAIPGYDLIEALWLGPDGEEIPVQEHLISIQQNPLLFGLSKRDVSGANIKDLRNLGVALIKQGWIRFRRFGFRYLFEINDISAVNKSKIDDLLCKIGIPSIDGITIYTIKGREEYQGKVSDLWDNTLFNHPKNSKNKWRLS
jgi:hypothetical protein